MGCRCRVYRNQGTWAIISLWISVAMIRRFKPIIDFKFWDRFSTLLWISKDHEQQCSDTAHICLCRFIYILDISQIRLVKVTGFFNFPNCWLVISVQDPLAYQFPANYTRIHKLKESLELFSVSIRDTLPQTVTSDLSCRSLMSLNLSWIYDRTCQIKSAAD